MDEIKPHAPTVYNYDPTDCFLISEDVADLDPVEGKALLPAFATFVEPPSKITDGAEIAVFDPASDAWVMRANIYWRPRLERRHVRLNHSLTGDLSITQLPFLGGRYRGIPRVMSSATISMSLAGRLHYLNARAHEVQVAHSQRVHGYTLEALHQARITSEDFVAQIKRFLDDVFMHEWIELERDSRIAHGAMVVTLQGYNQIDQLPSGTTKDHLVAMRDQDPEFFRTIVDLRNSFAHHVAVAEAYPLVGEEHPTVSTIYTKNGDLSKLELIEVYVEDLTRSLNNFVQRTFGPSR